MSKRAWVLTGTVVVVIVLAAAIVVSRRNGDGDAADVGASDIPPAQDAAFPMRVAYFSARYPEEWSRRGSDAFTTFTPTLGLYNSLDEQVLDQQLEWAQEAHIDAFVVPWAARNDITDRNLRAIMEHSGESGPAWSIYYEPEGRGNPTPQEIVGDLRYLEERYFGLPNYLTIAGEPVLFVYARSDNGEMIDRWLEAEQQYGGPLYLVLKVFSGFREEPAQPDSWHQFDPAMPYAEHLPYAAYVSPGFAVPGEAERLPRDPARFEADVERLVLSGADWQMVETWNDWSEGTSVEPTEEYGTTYVDILGRHPTPP